MTDRIRVLVVDDTPDIRMLLRTAFSMMGDFNVVGEAGDGAEAVILAGELHPDAVLLDLAMPVMDGLQAAPLIRERSPESRIVILSGFSKDKLGDDAFAAGADEYIEKGTSPKTIAEVVRRVCAGTRGDGRAPTSAGTADEPSPATGRADGWQGRLATAIEQAPTLGEAFTTFGQMVRSRVEFDRAGFALAEGDSWRIAATCGREDKFFPLGTVLPMPTAFIEPLDQGQVVTINDTDAREGGPIDRYFADRGVRSYAAVPIRAGGRAQAVVGFASERPRAFEAEIVDVLRAAVSDASTALHILWHVENTRSGNGDGAVPEVEWGRIIRHDLRSPLTVISGFAETMRATWSDLPETQKLEFIDAIARGADAMTTLLSDMEHVDRMGSGVASDEPRPLRLCALVDQTARDIMSSRDRVIVTSIERDLPDAFADEHGQRRVLSNLLENAFKFAGTDEPVEVAVDSSGSMIHVTVTDHGPGIAERDRAALFDKFYRVADPTGPQVPGSGLGLYICRSIVEAQGGNIWVESTVGEGTTFQYTIPAAVSSAA